VPATIKDVARAAGVHISTVSRTFSAPHLVNPDTRTRVMTIAEQLGYRPNRAARALITGRTHNIGLIVADIANPFFPPLIKAAESQARMRDYHVFMADTDEDAGVEEKLIGALAKQVDGILLCSPRLANSTIEQLAAEVPLVTVNRPVPGLPAVLMDVAHGARAAMDHLVGLGHTDIVLLAGPRGSWASRELRRTAGRAPGARLTVLGPFPPNERGGAEAARQVRGTNATAVLAFNDLMAIGLLEGLDGLGISVPGEVSVVGIDDILLSRFTRPRLTTVATPAADAGRAAVDLLLQRAESGATAQLSLPTELVVRESTAVRQSFALTVR
jgi:LacI family transcriptional regulator